MDVDPRLRLGHAVRSRRLELGISQEELAERSGLHRTYIGGIERGERNPTLVNIVRVAIALATTPDRLLEGVVRPEEIILWRDGSLGSPGRGLQ